MTGVRSALDLSVLVVWVPAVLLAVGLFGRFCDAGGRLSQGLPSRLFITAAVAVPLLNKHALRPIPTQLLLFPVVAGILILLWANARPRSPYLVGALAGIGTAVLLAFPGPGRALHGTFALPGRILGNLDLVATDRNAIKRANEQRYSPDRFAGYSRELAVAANLRAHLDPKRDDQLYVLGDAPVLYVLLKQRPPWEVTPYNTSPLSDQRRAVAWLDEHSPRFVVVDRVNLSFDNVPHAVRIPVVFQRVIENYVLDHSVGPFDVLRRRRPGSPIDARYWAGALGDVDLGNLPNVSSYDRLRPCAHDRSDECGRFLRLRAPRPDWAGPIQVPVRFGRQIVVIRFIASGKRLLYTVPLARTWGWAISRNPALAGSPTPGVRATIVSGVQPRDVLY